MCCSLKNKAHLGQKNFIFFFFLGGGGVKLGDHDAQENNLCLRIMDTKTAFVKKIKILYSQNYHDSIKDNIFLE